MPNYNKVILIGHLTRDPETRNYAGGTACGFSLAVNHEWKTGGGEKKKEVCFIDCTAFGKAGEVIAQYMRKGRAMLVEGRLRLEVWEAKDGGGKRSKHSVIVDQFQFLGDGKPSSDPADPGYVHDRSSAAPETEASKARGEDYPF